MATPNELTPSLLNRRTLLGGVLATLSLWVAEAEAQSSSPAIIGWLNMNTREVGGHLLRTFKDGLAELGWKEGAQFVIEERWADNRFDRLDALARELAAKQPAVIVAGPSQPVRALVRAAPMTPIVHATGADPVAAGFAASMARPGGMVTGLANAMTDVSEKFLELLLAAVPTLRRVGFLTDSTNLGRVRIDEGIRRAIARTGIAATVVEAGRPEEIEPALARLAKEGAAGLVIGPSPLFAGERRRLLALVLSRRWPVIGPLREFAEDGALLSYGHDVSLNYRRAAHYVDRILKGAKPAELPIEDPVRIEFVVNLRSARALGLTIPPAVMLRADRVIE